MALLTNKQAIGLVIIVGVAIWYARKKAAEALNAVNPLNNENIIYKSVEDTAVTDELDHAFAAIDLINPWAPDYRKQYAKQIWSD